MPVPKVVFDCMVFVQAAARHQGPARACFDAGMKRQIDLFTSLETLAELRDVLGRPELHDKFPELTDARVDRFVEEVLACSTLIEAVPVVYAHPLDKKDEPYVNLAIGASAKFIVNRDRRHMLCLMDRSKPHGIDFTDRFPDIQIVTPERMLTLLRQAV